MTMQSADCVRCSLQTACLAPCSLQTAQVLRLHATSLRSSTRAQQSFARTTPKISPNHPQIVHLQKNNCLHRRQNSSRMYYKEATKLPMAKTTRERRHETTIRAPSKKIFLGFLLHVVNLCLEYLGSIVRESASGYEVFYSGKKQSRGPCHENPDMT